MAGIRVAASDADGHRLGVTVEERSFLIARGLGSEEQPRSTTGDRKAGSTFRRATTFRRGICRLPSMQGHSLGFDGGEKTNDTHS